MAGDWIKIEHALPGKPEVMQIAAELDIEEDAVVGSLVRFWTWVDQNLSDECPVVSGTVSGLDRVVGRPGFAAAMISVGWLRMDGNLVEIPNYEHHLSQTAKARSVEAKRKKRQRDQSRKMSRTVPDKQRTQSGTREEKSNREENSAGALSACDEPQFDEIVNQWNTLDLPKCVKLSETRTRQLKARLRDEWWRNHWSEGIERIRSSTFCSGGGDNEWKASFDWFVKPDTLTKLLEGQYDDHNGNGRVSEPPKQRVPTEEEADEWTP